MATLAFPLRVRRGDLGGRVYLAIRAGLRLARRAPFSLGLLATMVVLGILTGSIHHRLHGTPLLEQVGFGLPALQHRQLYTLLTAIPFALFPWMLITITAMVVLLLLPYELVAGTHRAAGVFVVAQFGGYLLAALLVSWPLQALGTGWGHYLAASRDVGPSAGAFGAAAALVWHLPRRLRLAAGLALFLYLGGFLLVTHRIWDVEHMFAALIGLVLGARLAGEKLTLPRRRTFHALRSTPRRLIAGLVVLVGVLNILCVLSPHVERRVDALGTNPLSFTLVEGTTTLSVLAGLGLILLGRGLLHGRRLAWMTTLVLLPAPTVVHLLASGHLNPEAFALRALLAALLLERRNDFRARADVVTVRRASRIALSALALLPVYAGVGFVLQRHAFARHLTPALAARETLARMLFITTGQLTPTELHARWFLDSISVAWAAVLVYAALALLRPVLRPTVTSERDAELADELLRRWGDTGVSYMTSWPGNVRLVNGAGDAYIAYRLIGGVALVLGDPIGTPDGAVRVLDEFVDICAGNGWTPAFYGVTPRYLAEFARHGLAAIQVGEDTLIDLTTLAFKGKAWQDVRTAINRAGREGIAFTFVDPVKADPALLAQLWEIDGAWKAAKNLPEMGFTLGKLEEPLDPAVRIGAAVNADGRVLGYVTWLPVPARGGWVLDLMRRRDGGFPGVMEFLIAKSALAFKDDGYRMLSLSAAPLARVTRGEEETRLLERALSVMGDKLDPFYNFHSLFEFKRKFQPTWAPVYLVYPGAASLPKIGYAIVRAYLPSLSTGDVRSLVAQGVSQRVSQRVSRGMPHRRTVRPAYRPAPAAPTAAQRTETPAAGVEPAPVELVS